MKRKIVNPVFFAAAFVVLGVLLCSANFVSAQCGTYFKTNYRAINKLYSQSFQQAALNDWTGDGRSDFWNFRRNPTTSMIDVIIYPAKPTGYWDWDNPIIYTTSLSNVNGTSGVPIKDFDADGRIDMFYDGRLHRNPGSGALTAAPPANDPDGSTQPIGYEDVNGDNRLDWVYVVFVGAGPYVASIRYQTQNADGSFSNKTNVLTGNTQNGFGFGNEQLGDFNGDGKADIIYGTYDINNSNTYHYVMLKNLGGGSFQMQTPVATDLDIPAETADFNNDGADDVLAGNAIFYGKPDATFNRVSVPGGGTPAELNGDNNPDIIQIGSNNLLAALINNGAGGFTQTIYPNTVVAPYQWKFEDFTGDGKADFYDARTIAPAFNFNIFGERLLSVKENVCQPSGETRLANIDGDYTPDVAVWSPNSGNWLSRNASWDTGVSPTTTFFNWGLGSFGDVPAPGDFDGDGKTDYSVYRNSTGTWYIKQSANNAWLVFRFGLTGDVAVPNDYDGGGKTDIAVFRPSDGNWYIWYSETQSFTALHFGATGDKPVPADFDGDSKTDIAIYRPSEGNWYYLKSSDGNYVVQHWGIDTDKPLPADYDGDNKADLAIYRDGIWWIFRSSTNSYAAMQWGAPGDIPMPVYRNSHSADMILYRPSSKTWHSYVYRAFQGFPLGTNGDVPVYFGLPNN
jgi:hypothetical protein